MRRGQQRGTPWHSEPLKGYRPRFLIHDGSVMKGERKCPVCDTPVSEDAIECPSCGLPKELWPDQPDTVQFLSPSTEGGAVPPVQEPIPAPATEAPPKEEPVPEVPSEVPVEEIAPPKEAPAPEPPAIPEAPEPLPPPAPTPEPEAKVPTPEVPLEEAAPVKETPSVEQAIPEEIPAEPLPTEPVEVPSREEEVSPAEVAEPEPASAVQIPEVPAPTPDGDPDIIFAELAQANKRLVEIAVRYSVDVRAAAQILKRAASFWKINEKEDAIGQMHSARVELTNSIELKSAELLLESERNLNNFGPFATKEMQQVLSEMRAYQTTLDFDGFFSTLNKFQNLREASEKDLGSLGQLISMLNTLETGIMSLGGSQFNAKTFIEKAYAQTEKGRRKDGEAVLTMAVSQSIEILQPLIEKKVAQVSARLKEAHAGGVDVRGPAVLVRQITLALRGRRFVQVLQLLTRIDAVFPETSSRKKTPEKHSSSKSHVRAHSTVVDSKDTSSSTKGHSEELEIRSGRSYLFLESRSERGTAAFLQAKGSHRGLFLTASFPPKLLEETKLPDTELVWISESSGWKETYNPKVLDHEIASRILSFISDPGAAVVMLDGLAYMVTENGADRVEKFLKRLMDAASSRKITILGTLHAEGVGEKEVARLKGLFDQCIG